MPIKLWQRLHALAGVNILYYYINVGSKCSQFIVQLFQRGFEEPLGCLSVHELCSLNLGASWRALAGGENFSLLMQQIPCRNRARQSRVCYVVSSGGKAPFSVQARAFCELAQNHLNDMHSVLLPSCLPKSRV